MCLVLLTYNLYSLLEDCLEKYLPMRPIISNPPDGVIETRITCTKYLTGNGPIYIDLNGKNIGKIYRNRSTHVRLPEGPNKISAYRNNKDVIAEEGVVKKGCSLMVWSENNIPPKYHVAFLEGTEELDEKELMTSYKKIRKIVNSFTYQAMPIGIAGIVSMILIMKFTLGYL